jgi:integrase
MLLAQIMKAAVSNGMLHRNPCDGIRRPRLPVSVPTYLTAEEIDRLASEVPDRYRLLVYVLAYGGLRFGEAAALRRARCDLLHSELLVAENLSEVNGHLHWVEPKTHQQRRVVVPSFVTEVLGDHLDEFVGPSPDSLLFTAPDGGPLRYGNFLRRIWHPAIERADVQRGGTHLGRRTAATLLLDAGANVKDVQAQLGHRDASTTLNSYCAPYEGRRSELAARLDVAWRTARQDLEQDIITGA